MWATMSAVFLVVIIGGVLIAPVFVNTPASGGVVGALLQTALAFGLIIGGFLRWILKRPIQIAIRVAVAFCVFLILSVTLVAMFSAAYGTLPTILSLIAFAGAIGLTITQYFYPEWFVLDLVAILVAIGVSALLGHP
jgi:presenilin-like A22 family membrane protease